jgi:hypothetical protein
MIVSCSPLQVGYGELITCYISPECSLAMASLQYCKFIREVAKKIKTQETQNNNNTKWQ